MTLDKQLFSNSLQVVLMLNEVVSEPLLTAQTSGLQSCIPLSLRYVAEGHRNRFRVSHRIH